MHVVFEKSLCNGTVTMHHADSWDLLKVLLVRNVDTFD